MSHITSACIVFDLLVDVLTLFKGTVRTDLLEVDCGDSFG